jgi:hypothetical protein
MSPMTDENLTAFMTQLDQTLHALQGRHKLYAAIANKPFENTVETAYLFLGFICLYIVDEANGVVSVGAVSDTEQYRMSIEGYNFDVNTFKLALSDEQNSIVRAINTGDPQSTDDWTTVSRPQAPEGAARLNQANSGIAFTIVYPFVGKTRGALMYNYFQYQDAIGEQQYAFMRQYTDLVSSLVDKVKG